MSWLGTNSLRHRRGSSASSAGPAARPRRRRSTKTFHHNVRSFSSPRTVIREAFKRFGEHCARNQVRHRSPNTLSLSGRLPGSVRDPLPNSAQLAWAARLGTRRPGYIHLASRRDTVPRRYTSPPKSYRWRRCAKPRERLFAAEHSAPMKHPQAVCEPAARRPRTRTP